MLKSLRWERVGRRKVLILIFSCLLMCSLSTIVAVSGFLYHLTYTYLHKYVQSDANITTEVKHVAFLKVHKTKYVQSDANITTEVKHAAFLKVHKTGSSTVQNIFIRFGHSRSLTFILGSKTLNECGNFSNCISFYNSITSTNIVPPPKNKTFEILCSHVVYNKTQFRRYLPSDTRYIGIVREPVHRLESAIAWFKLLKGVPFSEFAEHPSKYNYAMLNNRMAFEFGFRKEWFPSVNYTHAKKSEVKEISEYVDQVINDFTLILINERLDESLVLMKRMLHWKTQDILYHSKLKRNHLSFTKQDSDKLRQYLYLDYLLYESALQNIDNKISKAGHDFYDEVEQFKDANKKVVHFCSNGTPKSSLTIPGTKLTNEFTINTDFCANLLRDEIQYLERIRKGQYTVTSPNEGRLTDKVYNHPKKHD